MDLVIVVGLLAAVGLLLYRIKPRRAESPPGHARSALDGVDTVAAWPPQATRIMTPAEGQAFHLLRTALPQHIVLAQVPLSRFMKVPTRHSYSEWLRRAGLLAVDLLVCDSSSHVLAVVDIRTDDVTSTDKERSRQRHARMDRMLEAAGIALHVWKETDLPGDAAKVRELILGRKASPFDTTSPVAVRPSSLAPLPTTAAATMVDLLLEPEPQRMTAEVDLLLEDAVRPPLEVDLLLDDEEDPRRRDPRLRRDPPPSTWFDDLDSGAVPFQSSASSGRNRQAEPH